MIKKIILPAIVTALSFPLLGGPAFSAPVSAAPVSATPSILPSAVKPSPAIKVEQPYTFAVPQGAHAATVFLTLTYAPDIKAGTVPDRLLRVESPVAGKAEIHTMSVDNNVMTTRPIDLLPLPPTGMFRFKPDGASIVLLDLKHALVAGDHVPLTLVFEKAGKIETQVVIRKPGDVPPSINPSTPKAAQ